MSGIKMKKKTKDGDVLGRRMMSQKHHGRSILSWGTTVAKLYFCIVCMDEHVTNPTMMYNYKAPIKKCWEIKESLLRRRK